VKLPRDEKFELSSQLRRAAVSIPSNIAEGYARESPGSYGQFLRIARGSLREIETQVQLAERVGLVRKVDIDPVMSQCDKVGKLLHGLIRSIQNNEREQ
jgi:four helix bundle protein